jgi:hypothetical protein
MKKQIIKLGVITLSVIMVTLSSCQKIKDDVSTVNPGNNFSGASNKILASNIFIETGSVGIVTWYINDACGNRLDSIDSHEGTHDHLIFGSATATLLPITGSDVGTTNPKTYNLTRGVFYYFVPKGSYSGNKILKVKIATGTVTWDNCFLFDGTTPFALYAPPTPPSMIASYQFRSTIINC